MTQLVLKSVAADLTGYKGFQWPSSGYVEAPDWKDNSEAGNGLHGWLNGEGIYVHHLNHDTDHKWLVIQPDDTVRWVDTQRPHNIRHKVKFRSGRVVYCGNKTGAVAYLIAHGAITAASDVSIACLTTAQCREAYTRARTRLPTDNPSNNYAAMAASFAADCADLGNIRDYDKAPRAAIASAFQAALMVPSAVAQREAHRIDKLQILGVIP